MLPANSMNKQKTHWNTCCSYKAFEQLQSLSESRMGSKVTKPTVSNSAKHYCDKNISVSSFFLLNKVQWMIRLAEYVHCMKDCWLQKLISTLLPQVHIATKQLLPKGYLLQKVRKGFLGTYLHCQTRVCWQRCFHCIYQVLLLLFE